MKLQLIKITQLTYLLLNKFISFTNINAVISNFNISEYVERILEIFADLQRKNGICWRIKDSISPENCLSGDI